MKISFVHGVCVQNDAISNAIRDEIGWIVEQPENEVRLFAYACDHPQLPFQQVNELRDISFDRFFQSSDVVVFHFGVFYPLFDLLPVVPKGASKVVVFHNVTPKECLPASAHEVIERSFAQMCNIAFADHVVCDSRTNQNVLVEAGIEVPSTILPLAVHGYAVAPERKPSFDTGTCRLAFVGRFVRSKGPCDLLACLEVLLEQEPHLRLQVDLVGNLHFSDDEVVSEVNARIGALLAKFGMRLKIGLHGSAPESVKSRILSDADLFVLPTRHEGFCVPILEAIDAGCTVVTYANSNTPAATGGFGLLVPTGDEKALIGAIADSLCKVRSSMWIADGGYAKHRAEGRQHLEQFRPQHVKRRFLHFLGRYNGGLLAS